MRGVWERQICFARSILEGLLKTHSHSVNNESLVTLMTEVELIISSRPLTVETMNDTKSDMPLSPSHLLTIKTNVVIPPSGEFSGPNLYSERRWRCWKMANFGTDGENNFSYKLNRNRRTKSEISKLEMLHR